MSVLRYDFHIHSALSPCADDDMTPGNIAGMAMLAGLDVIALTDHNSCLNSPVTARACASRGILFVPGMELTTAEEVHVLCLLPTLGAAADFSECVRAALPDCPNDPEIFGRQLVFDYRDEIVGEEELMLAGSSSIGIYDVFALLRSYGGVALPAHVTRPSFSVMSNLGRYDPGMGFTAFELTGPSEPTKVRREIPALAGLNCIRDSDAHALRAIEDGRHLIKLEEDSPAGVIEALLRGTL